MDVQLNSITVGDSRIKRSTADYAGTTKLRFHSSRAGMPNRIRTATSAAYQIAYQPRADDLIPTQIDQFPGEPYRIRRPIPVLIERVDDNDFLASFEEANLAFSGTTKREAFQNLAIEILNAFEMFSEQESNLGPEPIRQLAVLRSYLVRI